MPAPHWALRALLVLIPTFALACGDSSGAYCTPGRQVACDCEDGDEGIQICLENRTFDRCSCDWEGPSPVFPEPDGWQDEDGDPWSDGSGDGLSTEVDAGTAGADVSGVLLASGAGTLVDVFAQGTDVWVIDRDGVTRRALADGAELAHWPAPRPVVAAAFDGSTLVASDGAKFTVLESQTLEATLDSTLIEACSAGLLLSEGRFVCASAGDYNRVFYTYDVLTGNLLASSQNFSLDESLLRTVPGRAAFVASDFGFTLLELAENGEVLSRGSSTYLSDVDRTMVVTFDSASAAKNMINNQGLLLRVDTCDGTGASTCFERNGALGTLTGSQRFVALDTVEEQVFGLVRTNANSIPPFGEAEATQGLLLQVTDLPSREITQQHVVNLPGSGEVTTLRALPDQQAIVVALTLSDNSYPYDSSVSGFEVRSLSLE